MQGQASNPLVLVTGASGFVGRKLCSELEKDGFRLRLTVPPAQAHLVRGDVAPVEAVGLDTNWGPALKDVEIVVHLAARAHVLEETAADPLDAFRAINTASTQRLAYQAVEAGVKRIVFVSTIGVHGQTTPIDRPLTEISPVRPGSPYAQSKWEAEKILRQVEQASGVGVVIVRPPLVYGPEAPGSFGRLLRYVMRGLPLPLGLTRNRRSMIALTNVTDFLKVCITHSQAAGQTFLVSDSEDLSTTELVRRLALALNRPARLIPVPEQVARLGARLIKRENLVDQLWGSLVIDSSKGRKLLSWSPKVTVDEALKKIGVYYRGQSQ